MLLYMCMFDTGSVYLLHVYYLNFVGAVIISQSYCFTVGSYYSARV
jgi:hypothetical protein